MKPFPHGRRLPDEAGMLAVLLLLCAVVSLVTLREQPASPHAASSQVLRALSRVRTSSAGEGLVVATSSPDDLRFVELLRTGSAPDFNLLVTGEADAASRLGSAARPEWIVCSDASGRWLLWGRLAAQVPPLAGVPVIRPSRGRWPTFLLPSNLLNVANQISVIALIAVGMTLVIITGGIDLSVGSLVALSAVASTRLIRDCGGAESATGTTMLLAGAAAVCLCGAVGYASGLTITALGLPPFIVTLALMLVLSGWASILAGGESIYQVPDGFVALGRGATLGLPNAVILVLAAFVAAHVMLTRTAVGRLIYAVGSNREAARLSGAPVHAVLRRVYALSGALAGLGGVVLASQLKSGSPTYGQMYELYAIAAVVVGGTSLSGGRGSIAGTLVGALTIGVIQNGMNLLDVESFTQKVVLGFVILGAVATDRIRRSGGSREALARVHD